MSERDRQATVLCIASRLQGQRLLKELAAQGCGVLLLTLGGLEASDWPEEALTEVIGMPEGTSIEQIMARVSYLARHHCIDRIVGLTERDLETAAVLREHMRLPGMGLSTTRLFSDRLAMRVRARRAGIATAGFSPVLNYDDLRDFMEESPGPWLLTPRSVASGVAPRLIDRPQKVWQALDELGDGQSGYLLERAVSGVRYFVEAVSCARQILLRRVLSCWPAQELIPAGVLTTQVIASEALESRYVLDAHGHLLDALGMASGVSHAEFVHARGDGRYLFVEATACVGPALSAEAMAGATGISPWMEWAGIEAASLFGEEYVLPRIHEEFAAGSIVSRSGSSLEAPEVVYRSPGNLGVVVRSDSSNRLGELLEQFQR